MLRKLLEDVGTSVPGIHSPIEGTPDAPQESFENMRDEERVLQFLSECGGRARQSIVGSEIGWSKAKTSRILCEMEEHRSVVRHRSGREKIVFLSDQVPEFLDERQQ